MNKRILGNILGSLMLLSVSMSAHSETVVKYYWATWCTYCTQQKPIIDSLERDKKVKIVRIQTDNSPYGALPAIEILVNNKVVKSFVGLTSYKEISKYL